MTLRALVTRPAEQAREWVDRLRAAGLDAEALPLDYRIGIAQQALGRLPLSQRILSALLEHNGPYQPALQLAHAIEAADLRATRVLCEGYGYAAEDVNRALLRTLATLAGEAVKVWRAELVAGQGTPGEVIAAGPVVACGEGALKLTELQRAGGKRLPAREFLAGFPLVAGARCSTPA